MYHPEIVILDEAASSLDETTKQYVIHNLNSLFNGRTLIIISHKHDAWTAFDERLLLLEKMEAENPAIRVLL